MTFYDEVISSLQKISQLEEERKEVNRKFHLEKTNIIRNIHKNLTSKIEIKCDHLRVNIFQSIDAMFIDQYNYDRFLDGHFSVNTLPPFKNLILGNYLKKDDYEVYKYSKYGAKYILVPKDKDHLVKNHNDLKEFQALDRIFKILTTSYKTDERKLKEYEKLFKNKTLCYYIESLCPQAVNLEIFE